ncbi:hypothetical protein [Flavobacterium undicola]|uniref:hypothetical protein n=1 Tax=Flavobacterium undicola TaxID=1932779 RepID=UPI001377DEB2|nr:hypothetical protein [Flavobacterium undicola]MBA0883804.1 hypothetical protein [Flavobacterium undicola]
MNSKLVLFFQNNAVYIVAVLFAIPYIIRYFNSQEQKDSSQALDLAVKQNSAENAKSSPTIINDKAKVINKKYPNLKSKDSDRLKTIAQKIAFSLGTNPEDNHIIFNGSVELFNIRALVEDENTVVKLLKTTTGTFPIVEDYYYSLFTRSRNLKTDLYKYLSAENISQLRVAYKKANKNWI